MEEKERYENALIDGEKKGSVSQSGSQTAYDDLRNDNYSNLLDTQIQLSLARQNAMKSTNQMLASQGMLGTGYGGLTTSGIQSQYLSAMQNAKDSYYDREQSISSQERQEAEANRQYEFSKL